MEGMGQSLSIHREMTFDSRDLLTSIISFVLGAVSVLYALSIHDTEASFFLPTVAASGPANQLFLRPLPAGNLPLGRVSHSIAGNTGSKCASWESLLAACATESRFSRHTAHHRVGHSGPVAAALMRMAMREPMPPAMRAAIIPPREFIPMVRTNPTRSQSRGSFEELLMGAVNR
jgi:hypothetical protein